MCFLGSNREFETNTYDALGRMDTLSRNGVVQAEYEYNYLGQHAIRRLTQTGQMLHTVYDPDGNRIAEYDYDPLTETSTPPEGV